MDRGGAVVPVYILDNDAELGWQTGAAARWWLHHSLGALHASLRERGSRLILVRGNAESVLRELIQELGATALYWNRRYELPAVAADGWLESSLSAANI